MQVIEKPVLLLRDERKVRLVVTPHPIIDQGRISIDLLLSGCKTLKTVTDKLEIDSNWVVEVGGRRVPQHMWSKARLKHGQVIECRPLVQDKGVLRAVAFMVLYWYTMGGGNSWLMSATGATAGSFSGFAVGAAAFYVGATLINRVLPPPIAGMMSLSSNKVEPTYSLSGGQNSMRPWQPMSIVWGQPYCVPDLASQPWTYFEGEHQYLVQVFHGGLNCASIDSFRIGQTALSKYKNITKYAIGLNTYPENTYEKLPSNNVDSISGALLDFSEHFAVNVVRTTSPNTVKIQVDLELSLFAVNQTTGEYDWRPVVIEASYSRIGESNWTRFFAGHVGAAVSNLSFEVRNSSTKPRRFTLSADVEMGQYNVMLSKATRNTELSNEKNDVVWTTLRSFQADLKNYPGQALFAMSIQATGQLNGTITDFNYVATAKQAPYWNGSNWITATNRSNGLSNPGVQILQYARGIFDENNRLIAGLGWQDTRIDIEGLKRFMVWCDRNSFTFDAVIQQAMSHTDMLSTIAYAGMGEIGWPDGKLSVTFLDDQAPIEGVINMANIKARSFSVNYSVSERADEIEYGYFDRANNNSWNSLRVLAPGVTMPTSTARLSNIGITSEAHAAVLARFAMAQNIYMTKSIVFEQDMEFLTYKKGSVLALSHDLTQWGYGGRVASISNFSGVVSLKLDDEIPSTGPSGQVTRVIGLRLQGETQYRIFSLQPFTGSTREVTLATLWPAGAQFPGENEALWIYDFKSTPGLKVLVTKIDPIENQGGAKVSVTPLPDEFWPYVKTGAYTPAPNRSLLNKTATVTGAKFTEMLKRQGNSYATDLTVSFTVVGSCSYVEVWAANGLSSKSLLGRTESLSFTWAAGINETWSIELIPFDDFAQLGTSFSTTYSVVGLSFPPDDVSGLSLSLENNGIKISWDQCPNVDYKETVIKTGKSWQDGTEIARKSSTSHLLQYKTAGVIDIFAKHVDSIGMESINPTQTQINVYSPSKVLITRSEVQANTVAIGWSDAFTSQPIKSYSIYTSSVNDLFANAVLYGKAGADSRSDIVIFRNSGVKRIWLVAADVANNISEPSYIDVSVSLPTNFSLATEWDLNFQGTYRNSYFDRGSVYMPANTAETWGSHFSTRSWTNAQDQINAGYPIYVEPTTITSFYTETKDIGKVLPSVTIKTTSQYQTVFGSPSLTILIEWGADNITFEAAPLGSFDAQAKNVRYVRITHTVTSAAGKDFLRLDRSHVTVGAEEKSEFASITLNASDTNGTVYTTTKGFFDIVSVVFTPQSTSLGVQSAIRRWEVYFDDNLAPATPAKVYVLAWDAQNNRVGGVGSLQIGGT